ncbi:MAG: phospholipid carrier-dependent glycosyltransferase [Planctomycetota bacterium]
MLVLLFVVLGAWRAASDSEAYDEPMYLLSGYSYLVTGDLSFNREHPPLAKYLLALPLLALDLELPPDYQVRPGIEFQFFAHQPRASAATMLFLARLPGLVLGVLLLLYVWRWAALAFGGSAGLVALALAALNPNLIAHATTAGNDFALTVFGFLACFHLWRWLHGERQGPLPAGAKRHLLLCALMLGLALGSKLSALMLLPVFGLIVLVAALAWRRPALLGWAFVGGAAALGVLWLLYLGEARSLAEARVHPRFGLKGADGRVFHNEALESGLQRVFGSDQPIPLLSLLKGFDHQTEHAESGHSNYWRGEVSKQGAPEFFALSWLIKNPEGFSLLLLLSLLALWRAWRGALHEAALWLYPLLLLAFLSLGDVQLGFKYALPVVPFFAVAASRFADPSLLGRGERRLAVALLVLAALLGRFGFGDTGAWHLRHELTLIVPLVAAALLFRAGRAPAAAAPTMSAVGVLVLWASLASLARQPQNHMYFNEWVGGPENGWRWSIIGDDWGQDTARLGRWMASRTRAQVAPGAPDEPDEPDWIYYDPYTEGDPEVWGVRYRPIFGGQNLDTPQQPWVAVHLALQLRMPEAYAFLADKQPEFMIGHTIRMYRLTPEEMNAARTAKPRTTGF